MKKSDFKPRFLLKYLSDFKQRPVDGIAFTFLLIVSVLTYLNGTFVLLPLLLEKLGFPSYLLYVAYLVTTWIVTAILSNMFLIRNRSSSIANRMLLQPAVKTPTFKEFLRNPNKTRDDLIKEETKNIGQHFMPKPFGEEGNWHICASCEVFVPPRTWHCTQCKTCILRRDHHCIFAMTCIGEENHANFLGLVLYLAIGSTLATVVNILYSAMLMNTTFWWFAIKAFIPFYTAIFDFSVFNSLASTNFLGMGCAWVVLINYILMALKSQTCFDNLDAKTRTSTKYAYSNAVKFLGDSPIRKVFWPFHVVQKISYGQPEVPETRKQL